MIILSFHPEIMIIIIDVEIMKRIVSEKKTSLPSLRNQIWETVETDLNNLIYVGTKLVWLSMMLARSRHTQMDDQKTTLIQKDLQKGTAPIIDP